MRRAQRARALDGPPDCAHVQRLELRLRRSLRVPQGAIGVTLRGVATQHALQVAPEFSVRVRQVRTAGLGDARRRRRGQP
eukprot:5444936-Prymnesium_polylepis.1